uniref:F-box domain-containing protein n=1 Tax=Glossina pallidipes TaxID=7398 RepID=A0A1A9ZAT6_GLOPL
MSTNAEILPFHHQTILTFQRAAADTNYGGVGRGSSGISTASQLAAAWSTGDHLFQQTELPVLTRSTCHMLRFGPYALPHRPQLQPVPPAFILQHAAAAAAISNLFPEILELIYNKLSVCDLGRAAQVLRHGAVLPILKAYGVQAKLRLKRSSPSLFNCFVKRGIKKITDTSLGRIAQHLKNLQTLDLGGCCNITNTALLLIHLNLRSCCISDQAIGHLAGLNKANAEGNLKLEFLGLQDCNRLSDEVLGHIAQGLTSLKSVYKCLSITDIGMAYLTESSSNLNSLDVSFCVKISDLALAHIAQCLCQLRSLSLIIDQGILKIAKALPELESKYWPMRRHYRQRFANARRGIA